jgi:hypothetical protein
MPARRKYFTAEARLEARRRANRVYRGRNRALINRAERERYAASQETRLRKARNKKPLSGRKLAAALAYQRGYLKANPHKAAMFAANRNHKRRHGLGLSTPRWANRFFMEEAYGLARLRTRLTGKRWHVDHIVPIRSPKVCGLHCHTNLAVILGASNASKRNRYWPDMPSTAKGP